MREIKFRAFIQGEMVYLPFAGLQHFDFEGSYALSFAVDGYAEFWAHEQYDRRTKEIKDSPVMQYTGLKDKNGKEIYEGDIVSNGVTKSGTVIAWPVVFHFDSWALGWEKHKPYRPNKGFWKRTEVIGNIHENPELLNPIK